jgi:two-component system phosphate regulon sensor histidine kinase PhoR
MPWWLARTAAALLVVLGSALIGGLVGAMVQAALTASLVSAVLALVLLVLRDSWRGHRLMDWLRGPQVESAPRHNGFWGEMGYRVERTLRARDLRITQEEQRLEQFLSAIEASPNGVMLLDEAEQIEWCNSVPQNTSASTRCATGVSASPTSCACRPLSPICSRAT